MGNRAKRRHPLYRNILIQIAHHVGADMVCRTDTEQVERYCILLRTSVISRRHREVVVTELARISGMIPEHFTDMREHIDLTRQELSAAAA